MEAHEAFDPGLWERRAPKYNELRWVNESDPIKEMLSRLKLRGDEFVVDVGTGTQAVLHAIKPVLCQGGKAVGFDLSFDMLNTGEAGKELRSKVFVADVTHIPLPSEVADVAIARQVIHHIPIPEEAIQEMARIVKPGGKVVIAEHIVINKEVMAFERRLFDIKEPGRHLWLPGQLISLIENTGLFSGVNFFAGFIPNYPMFQEWLEKSGLSSDIQKRALECLRNAPDEVKQELNIRVAERDITMDGHYLCVIAEK